ncbi:hypothetical protein EYF80_048635 [Liparis tanakae]|uniref:Uncharacterized protein n=1 Tax=Liparis tanakae TaxID=230148 RepID=A0A4Z2FJ27_9TELE|nr:hypothetical protein EYF80_048635 [Liparis tanakae]
MCRASASVSTEEEEAGAAKRRFISGAAEARGAELIQGPHRNRGQAIQGQIQTLKTPQTL